MTDNLSVTDCVTPQVTDYLSEGDTMVPVNAVVLVEFMDQDGQRTIRMCRPDDTTSWTAMGMIEAARCWLKHDYDDGRQEG